MMMTTSLLETQNHWKHYNKKNIQGIARTVLTIVIPMTQNRNKTFRECLKKLN